MEKAAVLIVEDQMLIAKSIESMIVSYDMEVLAICKTGEEAIAVAEGRAPDIIIMDIKLQGKMDGIQTAKKMRDIGHIPVIYLSDYTDKGTVRKAKETFPANYLSKPFTESDLIRAIEITLYNANASRAKIDSNEEFIFLKTAPHTHSKVQYNEILFIEAERAYCKVHTIDKVHTVSINMSAVAEQLSQDRFVKIHRSYIVNLRKISEFSGTKVTVAGHKLPVSDQNRAELMARLKVLH